MSWNGKCGGCGANFYKREKCRCSPAARARMRREREDKLMGVYRRGSGVGTRKPEITKVTKKSEAEIVRLYKGGMTLKGLAEAVRISNGFETKEEARKYVDSVILENIVDEARANALRGEANA